jgi:peroxiredoxin Q/BCP
MFRIAGTIKLMDHSQPTEALPPIEGQPTALPPLRRRRRVVIGLLALIVVWGAYLLWQETMPRIQVGDRAPDFTATAQDGRQISLADYLGKKAVVVYFYPKDNTSVCTTQACSFRDAYEDFVKAGAEVIGVSSDSSESHRGFAEKQRLPFVLVSDENQSLRKAFGVPNTLAIIPGRVTYVIDRDGIVRHIFNSQLNAARHITESLEIVRKLSP